SDLQMRYGRGGIRALKWILDPYAALGIYLLLVALILNRSGADPGLSLACAIVPFQLVTTTFAASLRAVALRSPIIVHMALHHGQGSRCDALHPVHRAVRDVSQRRALRTIPGRLGGALPVGRGRNRGRDLPAAVPAGAAQPRKAGRMSIALDATQATPATAGE